MESHATANGTWPPAGAACDTYGKRHCEYRAWIVWLHVALATVALVSNVKLCGMLAYALRVKWFGPDFLFALISGANLVYAMATLVFARHAIGDRWPASALEVAVGGYVQSAYVLVYATLLLLGALEMWFALEHPLWHLTQLSSDFVVRVAAACVAAALLVSAAPALLAPHASYTYYAPVFVYTLASYSPAHAAWMALVSLVCAFTIGFCARVTLLVTRCDPCRKYTAEQRRTETCPCRLLRVSAFFLFRFAMTWWLDVMLMIAFATLSTLILLLHYSLYVNAVGDGFVYFLFIRRFRQNKRRIVKLLARNSQCGSVTLHVVL